MKETVNTYIAIIIILVAGMAAVWVIVHVANSNVSSFSGGSEADYSSLEQSILK